MVTVAQAGPITNPFDHLIIDLPLPGSNTQMIGPWPDRIHGSIVLQGRAWSPLNNTVDIKIEALVYNHYTSSFDRILHAEGDGVLVDLGLLVDSTRNLVGVTDSDQPFTVIAPAVDLAAMGVKVSGIGENGADTMVSVYYMGGGGVA